MIPISNNLPVHFLDVDIVMVWKCD